MILVIFIELSRLYELQTRNLLRLKTIQRVIREDKLNCHNTLMIRILVICNIESELIIAIKITERVH